MMNSLLTDVRRQTYTYQDERPPLVKTRKTRFFRDESYNNKYLLTYLERFFASVDYYTIILLNLSKLLQQFFINIISVASVGCGCLVSNQIRTKSSRSSNL